MDLMAKLRGMMSAELLRDVAYTWSGQIVGSGIGFLIALMTQRQLTPTEYGMLGLASSTGALSAVLTDLGLSHAMVRFGSKHLSQEPETARAYFAATLWTRLVLALLVSVAGVLSAGWMASTLFHNPALEEPLTWVYACSASGALYSFWQFYIQTCRNFALRSGIQVGLALVKLLFFGALIWLDRISALSMLILDAGISFLAFGVGMAYAGKELLRVPLVQLQVPLHTLAGYARFTGILLLSDVIFSELDTFMLGIYCTEEVVGIYRCAWTYALVLGFLNMSVSNVLFPRVTALEGVVELRRAMGKVVRFSGVLAVATLPVLPFMHVWIPFFQPSYEAAFGIFVVMYVGLLFELVVGPLQYVLYSLDRPGLLATAAVVKMVLEVVGNIIFIPWMGAYGAALTTLLARVVGGLMTLWLIERELTRRAAVPVAGSV